MTQVGRLDHIRIVQDELRRYGLASTLERTGSGHCAITWMGFKGPRTYVQSYSPSDNARTALNARAQVRRMLREDGHEPPRQRERTALERLTTPGQPVDPLARRVAQLEYEMALMLDVLASLTAAPPNATQPKRQRTKADAQHPIVQALEFNAYTPLSVLASKVGKPPAQVATTLAYLAKRGLVQNLPRTGWKRSPISANGSTQHGP